MILGKVRDPRLITIRRGGTPTITCRTTGRSGFRLRDAYIDVRFSKAESKTALYLRAGQEKRRARRPRASVRAHGLRGPVPVHCRAM